MKVTVDFSIFTKSGAAFANANGTLELDVLPHIGDTISFAFPKETGLAPVPGFTGMLRVRDRVLDAGGALGVSLALDDLVMQTIGEADAVAEYFEKGFGLGVNKY